MPRRPRIITTVALTVIVAALGTVAGFWGYIYATSAADRVFPGVYVKGVSLGGLSRHACTQRLKALEEEFRSTRVKLVYQDTSWWISLRDIGLRRDVDRMVFLAMRAGREGNFVTRWAARRRMKTAGYEVPLLLSVDRELLRRRVSEFGQNLIIPPRDAGFVVRPGDRVEIVPHAEGRDVDIEQLHRAIQQALMNGTGTPRVPLYLVAVMPRHTTQDVLAMGITGLLASYTTSFDPTLVNRAYNISVAAAALDGLLVPPGQEVSFNKIVGPRSQEAGYKDALVIQDDNFVPGIGGGVCQVSSTLYNAVLLANLKVTERANHSLPVAYVPLGRDATVAYGAVDLKFVNNTPSYIYIRSFVRGSRVTIKVYGNTRYKRRVEIRTRTLEIFEPEKKYEEDPNLEAGKQVVKQAGQRGYRVQAERWIWDHGRVIIEALPASLYKPRDEIIAVGTRVVPSTVTPPPTPPAGETPAPGGTTPPPESPSPSGEQPGGTPLPPAQGEVLPPEPITP